MENQLTNCAMKKQIRMQDWNSGMVQFYLIRIRRYEFLFPQNINAGIIR